MTGHEALLSFQRVKQFSLSISLCFFLCLLIGSVFPSALLGQSNRSQGNPVYTISNFEVWAEAEHAVAAKQAALEDGKVVAFQQLLKRLTSVNSFKHRPSPPVDEISKMIVALSVKDERNSKTEYLANMDFKFSSKAVKAFMRLHGLPYYDRQDAPLTIVPVVDQSLLTPLPGQQASRLSQSDWETSFKTLDLKHGLVPISLSERLAVVDDAVLAALVKNDNQAKKGLLEAYKKPAVVLALISEAPKSNAIRLTIIGHDGVGDVFYQRDHIVTKSDFVQAADFAAEVAQGMFDSRVKLKKMRTIDVAAVKQPQEVLPWQTDLKEAAPVTGWQSEIGGERLRLHVQFRGLRHWQVLRQQLIDVQGVEDLNIEKLSARGADISLEFPGGIDAFRSALQARGLVLRSDGQGHILLDG